MNGVVIAAIIVISVVAIAAAICGGLFYCSYKSLKEQNRLLDKLLENSNDYRIDWNTDLSEVKYSKNTLDALNQYGTSPDADYLRTIFSSPEQIGPVNNITLSVNALREGGVTARLNYSDGVSGLVQWKSEAIPVKKGVSKIISVGNDISDVSVSRTVMDRFKEKYQEEHNFFRILEKNSDMSEFVLETSGEDMNVRLSEEMMRVLGFESGNRITLDDFYGLINEEYSLAFQRNINRLLSRITDAVSFEVKIKTARNLTRAYLIRCKRVREGESEDIIGAMVDITGIGGNGEFSEKEQYLDVQTGLLNRNGFMKHGAELLEQLRKENKPCVVICLQLVRLQKVITLFGIDTADRLTRLFAETLQQLMPDNSVAGKIGVEDFALMIQCGDRESVDRLMKEITIIMENNCNNQVLPSVLKEQSRFIAGACFYDGIDDIAAVYNKASVTLFSGSRITGNICCYFDASIEKRVCDRDIVGQEIGEALKQGDLELYYQPKICFRTGEIIGVEALMRWNHRSQGLIMPGDFIPIAEEIGIITKIDEWGLIQACIQAKMWQDKGYPPVKVSVNMSQAQLYQTDVVETVRVALKESGLDAKWLEVELTETMAMLDIERTVSVLTQLQKLGVSISMDDFGTGYSSLSSLKILPINQLKIDRSLVYDIETNETARHVTKAIVDLGKAMRLDILAEGVETDGQRILLESLGCDVAQGYLYSRPEPSAIIEKRFLIPAMHKKTAQTV